MSKFSPPDSAIHPADAESRLVTRAIDGERDAFGDLYERHLTAIYRYIFYRLGEIREAEDLTAMVFLKAWSALNRYQPGDTPFIAWLYRIAHNTVTDWRRSHRETEPLADQVVDPHPDSDPVAQAEAHEQQAALTAALRKLDPNQQQVLTLRFISGLSHTETAQIMQRSEGSIRVLQHRALARLRNVLLEEKNHHAA